jgi:hypothetical protein
LLKYLLKEGQFMACRFLKVMLESLLTESRKDGKTSTLGSIDVMEKRNYNMPSTHGFVGTSAT